MTEVALHHVDRSAGVEQGGRLGVTQAVAAGEEKRLSISAAQVEGEAEPAQYPVVVACLPWFGCVPVSGGLGEQVPRRRGGRELPSSADPGLLLTDDLDDVSADQDGVGGTVDFGLLVAQFGDHP